MVWRSDKRKMLAAKLAGDPMDWEALLDGYAATVDHPLCLYYKELMVAFPDAVVILTGE